MREIEPKYQEILKNFYTKEDLEAAKKLIEQHPELASFAKKGFDFGVFSFKDFLRRDYLNESKEKLHTAQHENGHAIAAKVLGWNVQVISIVAEGNVLGFTRAVPGKSKPVEELLFDKIVIAFAGMAAEMLAGNHDHSGCGSDIAQATFFAEICGNMQGQKKESMGKILSSGWQVAWDIVSSYGSNNLDSSSFPMLNNPVRS